MTNSTVYSTATGEKTASFEGLSQELRWDLDLPSELDLRDDSFSAFPDDYEYYMNEFCFVCSRHTDHRGEHDDLVEKGLAFYDETFPMVHRFDPRR